MADMNIQCTCGELQGTAADVGPTKGVRVMCYCRDCASFGWFVDRADELLDAYGGTDIYQLWHSRVSITSGADKLACMRLSEKGLLRWYTSCCRTPVANTMANPKVPFVGLISAVWDPSLDASGQNALLGQTRAVNGPGYPAPDGSRADVPRFPIGTFVASFANVGKGVLRKAYQPSPFFAAGADGPIVTPTVLSQDERHALRARMPR